MKFTLPPIEKRLVVRNTEEIENKEIIVKRLNAVYRTPFKSKLIDNQIVIEKRIFSDFWPFNLFHLMALNFYAYSESLENHKSDQILFTIKPKLLTEMNLIFGYVVLIVVIIGLLLSREYIFGLIILVVFAIMILLERIFKISGVSNFAKNWDQYIN
jgi:hypothetical protein